MKMEKETSQKILDFVNSDNIRSQILNAIRLHRKSIEINFLELSEYDFELSEQVIEEFDEFLNEFNKQINHSLLKIGENELSARFANFPESYHEAISKLRAHNLNGLVVIRGYIKKISEVLHEEIESVFECPACGNRVTIQQRYAEIYTPTKCVACGERRKLMKVDRKTEDLQKLIIEEDVNDLDDISQNARRILVKLRNDLCRYDIDKSLQPSRKVEIVGIMKDEPLGKKSKEYKKYIEANNIKVIDDSYSNIVISEDDMELFYQMSKQDSVIQDITTSIFSTIYGNESAKLALTLQMFGGTDFYDGKHLEERGNIHILLISSPGRGKTVLMRRAMRYVPGSKFGSGKGVSSVGLVAAVVSDDDLGGYVLEAGMLPMCTEKVAYIDEIDKIKHDDLAAMNNAMVDLQVTVHKAAIHETLPCKTSVCCAANPTNRVFDKRFPAWQQIGLPKDFADRFDMILPVDDINDEETQRKVAKTIFDKIHLKHKKTQIYDDDTIIKYISYARNNVAPKIPDEVQEYLIENYIHLIKPSKKTIEDAEEAYFSSRLLPNIIRLTCAVAKAKLKQYCDVNDAKTAVDLMIDSFKKQDIISPEGLLDFDKLEAVTPKKKRDAFFTLKESIKRTCNEQGIAMYDKMLEFCVEKGMDDIEFEEMLFKLKKRGDIIEPRRRHYKLF